MANKVTNTDNYTAIANAIRAKTGSSDTYTPAEMAGAIRSIPQGGAEENDVTFYDYDGTVVKSYTAAQFANLEALPDNPDHTDEGLTSQGWNWSLSDAKTYVSKYRKLNIGQTYIPTDGKTHIYIHIGKDDPTYETNLHFFHKTGQDTTVIDWGDGSATETVVGVLSTDFNHVYQSHGDYIITLDTVGTLYVTSTANSANATHFFGPGGYACNFTRIYKIHFSDKVLLYDYALEYCYSLEAVTIPVGITNIGPYCFYNCINLRNITIPSGLTNVSGYSFANCYSLRNVSIPKSVTSTGSYVFNRCYSLSFVTIPDDVNILNGYMFYYCYTLKGVTIPDSVTSIGNYAFASCFTLNGVTIPDNVTSIGGSAFSNCTGLSNVTIPSNVENIQSSAFSSCVSVKAFHIKPTIPPTMQTTSAFGSMSTDTKMYVPTESLEAYKTANNWSTYADRMIGE